MKDNILKIGAIITGIGLIIVLSGFLFNQGKNLGGVIPTEPSYSSASSTLYAVGNELSTKVLDSKSRRGGFRICNNTTNDGTAQDIYLVLGSTAVTATTSADTVIEDDECLNNNDLPNYTGELQIITDVSSTTSAFVTEFIY